MSSKYRAGIIAALALAAIGGIFYFVTVSERKTVGLDPETEEAAPVPAPSTPDFVEFKTENVFAGEPAKPDFTSNPAAENFKTAIAEQAQAGPNFAGKYTVVSWDCGSECQEHAILDSETGGIIKYDSDLTTTRGASYKLNSNLLILNPIEPGTNTEGLSATSVIRYYAIEGGVLRRVYEKECEPVGGEIVCGRVFFGHVTKTERTDGALLLNVNEIEFLSEEEALRNTEVSVARYLIGERALIGLQQNPGSPLLYPLPAADFEKEFSENGFVRNALFRFMAEGNTVLQIKQQHAP